jgi:hypothetical protein
MREILNDKPLRYDAKMCISFKAAKSDLRGGVVVSSEWPVTQLQLCKAFAEFGGYHAMHIWPNLNGFGGYDCTRYTIECEMEVEDA